MANNIEQQWANVNLNDDLSNIASDTTQNKNDNLASKVFSLQDATNNKLNTLNNNTQQKQRDLAGYEDVTIVGLEDADTAKLADGRTVRLSTPLTRYDAAEISHPEEEGFFNKFKSAIGLGNTSKSDYAEEQQKRQVAMVLGKQPTAVTDQDIIDVGNMQQIQMLSDLIREQGQERWEAPLVKGVAQTDLNQGLNIKAKLRTDSTDEYGRVLGSFVNPNTGIDVVKQHAEDPRLNAFSPEALNYGYVRDKDGVRRDTLDKDGYLMNLVDAAQFGLGSATARVGDAVGDLLSRTAKEVYKALPGDATEEQASLAIGKALQGVGYDEKGNFTALDKFKNPETYGYDNHRVNDYVEKLTGTLNDPKATLADKALVMFEGLIHGPEVLTSSTGDMLLGMTGVPGLALMAAGQANEVLAQRAKNKGTTDLDVSDYGISLASGVIYSAVNMLTKGNVGLADAKKTILEAAKHMDGPALAAVTTKLTKDGFGEGLEEIFQGVTGVLGEKLLTPKEDEILTKKTALDLAAQGVLGFSGGVTGAVVGEVKPGEIASAVMEKATELRTKQPEKEQQKAEEEIISGDAVTEVYMKAADVFDLTDNPDTPLDTKINSLRELEEQAYRIDENDKGRQDLLNNIKIEKSKIASQLENTDDVSSYTKVLGSKQGFLDLMDDVMEGTNNAPSEKLDTNLKKIAESFGITDEQFAKIKKDYATVEVEATQSSKGYLTQGKALRNILSNDNPDVKKAEKLLGRMRNFEQSQIKWLENYENTLTELEAQVNEYNSDVKKGLSGTTLAPKQTTIPGTTSKINVKELSDGTYAVDYNGIDTIKAAKERNIKGIRAEIAKSKELLTKAGIKQVSTGVQEEAIIDTETISNKGLKSAVESVKKDFEKNKINSIIVSDTRSDRDNVIIRDNEQITNKGEYSSNDVVTILVPDIKTQKDFDKFLSSLRSKKNPFRKEIMAAQEGNATIILDKSLKEYEGKPAKKFKYTTVRGKAVSKSVREAIIMQMNQFATDKYAPTHFGSRVFKPVDVVAEEKKAEKTEQKVKDAKKEAKQKVLDKAFETYVKDDKVNFSDEVKEYFKEQEKFEAYLDNRLEKEVDEYVETSIKARRYLAQSINLKSRAENTENVDESTALLKTATELEAKAKKEFSRVKELSTIKSKADEVLAEMDANRKVGRDLLKRYREALELDTINGTNTAEELLGSEKQNILKEVLDNSVSKGSKDITLNDKNYITDISKIVKRTKPSVLDIIEVDDMFDSLETETGNTISSTEYIAKAKKFLQDKITTAKVIKKYGNLTELEITLANSPAYGLLFSKDGINDAVVMAMKLGLDEYISYKGRVLNPNYKTKEEVAQMVGVLDSQLGKEQFNLLKDKGVFKKTMDNELGKAIMSKLGLTKVKGIEDEVYNRLVAEVGQIATLLGIEEGIIVNDEIPVETYSKAIAEDNPSESAKVLTSEFKGEAKIRFVKFKTDSKKKLPEDKIKTTTSTYEAIHELIADDSSFRKEPKRRPISKEFRRNTREEVAKDTTGAQIPSNSTDQVSAKEAINNLVDMEWEYNTELINEIKSMDKDVLKSWLGFKTEEELALMTYESREAAIATNRDIEKNLEELIKLNDQEDSKSNKLFFDWFYTSNGRYMMDSNTVNPQTEKQLHRWLVTPVKHMMKYVYKDGVFKVRGKDITAEVKYALAQSMGFDVDKKSTAKINAFAEALLGMTKEQILEAKKTVFEDGKKYLLGDAHLEPEHVGHMLQGFKFLLDAKTAKKGVFQSNLSAEFDAVTSGFGLKLLQMPILKNVSKDKLKNIPSSMWYWLNKVGIFKTSQMKGIDSMNDVLDSEGFYLGGNERFYDSYQSLAAEMAINENDINDNAKKSIYKNVRFANVKTMYKGLQEVMPVLDADGTVSKALRTLFKDPFMTFNYSAGIRSIRASLSYKMMNDLLDGIVAEKPEFDSSAAFLAKQVGKNKKTLLEMLRTEPPSMIRTKENVSLEDILLKTFDSTYGAKVEDIMTKNFKEFMDAHKQINNAFRVMFEMFNIKYQARLAEVPVGELTIEKKLEIIDDLRKDFPVIKGPLSVNEKDGIHVYGTTSVTPSPEAERQAPAQTHIKTKDGVEQEKARFMVREFEAAISAGSVVPIHYIDGAVMAQLLGKDSAITAIHDAIIPPLKDAKSAIKTYNENMVKIGRKYSVISAINEMLNRPNYSKEELEKANEIKISVADNDGNYSDVGIGTYFNIVKTEFSSLNAKVTKAREELADEIDTGVLVGHMAGLPGSMWTNTTQEEVKEEPAKISKLDKIQREIGALFPVSDDIEQVLESMSEEQIDTLIEQLKCEG